MSGILVIAELEDGAFKKTAGELLGKASQLARELGVDVLAAVVGNGPAADLGRYGAARVYQVSGAFEAYSTTRLVTALAAIVEAAQPSVILAPSSYAGKDALPRLVARLGSGQGSECTELRVEGGQVVGRRPMYAGKCLADVRISRAPAVFTVRPNSFGQPAAASGSAEVIQVTANLADALVTVLERRRPASTSVDLTEAERIVSGGRSLKSAESFDAVIRPLAAALDAAVGASRAAVDAGYCSHSEQVGQTGKTVNPVLYIACGISGAIQHLAGMRTSKVIVAINKDPDAPIFEHATYGIVADLFEVCPALTEKLASQ